MSHDLRDLLDREIAAADAPPPAEVLPAVDLRTLLGELTALKSEARALSVEAREARQAADAGADGLRDQLDRAAQREDALRAAADDARREGMLALIDVSDRLEAALRTAGPPARRRWFAPRPDPALPALREGLHLTLRGLHARLEALGATRVTTRDARFDPDTMEALRADHRPDLPEGTVVDEITAGWRTARGVLRTAQVVVGRQEKTP